MRAAVLLCLVAGTAFGQPYTFSDFAGRRTFGAVDARGTAARLAGAQSIAADGRGNLYLTDSVNGTVRRIAIADAAVTTMAGLAGVWGDADGIGAAARFGDLDHVAADSGGTLYVLDGRVLRRINADGRVITIRDSFAQPLFVTAIAVDPAGTLYVAVRRTILRVESTGATTLIAGATNDGRFVDGTGTSARFFNVAALAADAFGDLYAADGCAIRKITRTGVVTTIAGVGGDWGIADGKGVAARFANPSALAVSRSGTVYVAGESGLSALRKITPDGDVTTIVDYPLVTRLTSVAVSGDDLFVVDAGRNAVVRIRDESSVEPFIGESDLTGNAGGPLRTATFSSGFRGVASGKDGSVYVADTYNNTIRKIASGVVTTLAGAAGVSGSADGKGAEARFNWPEALTVDAQGNLFVADTANSTIRKITPDGTVTTIAGLAMERGAVDGPGAIARFEGPAGVAADRQGNLYIADTGNSTIRKIASDGMVTTVAGKARDIYHHDGTGGDARFEHPSGITVDAQGNVFVTDPYDDTIRKITPAGVVTTYAGTTHQPGAVDGPRETSLFDQPHSITAGADGSLFVADTSNATIRRIAADGTVSTIGGRPGWWYGAEEGTGADAHFLAPLAIAAADDGAIYVADGAAVVRGVAALPVSATIDLAVAPAGAQRQLEATSRNATSWQWSIIRRPAGSTAQLSSESAPNPTFTPDVADVYVFRLTAAGGGATSTTTVALDATAAGRRRAAGRP